MEEFLQKLRETFPEAILKAEEFRGETTLEVEREKIIEVLAFLKREGPFDLLIDLTAVDFLKEKNQFALVYHLYSLPIKQRLRAKTWVPEGDPTMPSATKIWSAANWLEREVYDMFGIQFHGHPNLERILLWEGFPGHPLRKDFALREEVPLPEPE